MPDSATESHIEAEPEQTPETAAEMFALIDSIKSKTLGKHAQLLDSVAQNRPSSARLATPIPDNQTSDDDENGLYFGIALAKLPNMLGVRVNIFHRDEVVELRSDVSVEYTWENPVNYLDKPLVDFVSLEGIPRALTTASAILSDVAASIGRSVENSSWRMQTELVEYFQQSYSQRTQSDEVEGE